VLFRSPVPPRWAGLKFFNVYGPNEGHKGPMRSVVHQIYPVAARGDAVRLFKSDNPDYPDGGQLRDFIYVKDCSAVVRQMLTAERLSGIFNIGTGKARSFADLANAVFLALGREPRIEYFDMPETLRGRYQYFTEADTSKLSQAGLAPRFHDLESGVMDYVESHLTWEFAQG
jgi:ADP-L-glycero-D-manno-heptose 6-epimerase